MIDSHMIVWILEFQIFPVNFHAAFCISVNWWSSFPFVYNACILYNESIGFHSPSVGFHIGN